MLYWQVEKELQTELEQAIARFRVRYDSDPVIILVNKEEEAEFVSANCPLKIKKDKLMLKRHFGLL